LSECYTKSLLLSVARASIRVCEGRVEVVVSPRWDLAERCAYVVIGIAEEVLGELTRLAEDVSKVARVLEEMVGRGADPSDYGIVPPSSESLAL
jgi:hypothetical protein